MQANHKLVLAMLVLLLAVVLPFTAGQLSLDPTVPLSHCARFGRLGDFTIEWQLSLEPKNFIEVRFTSDIQRGFSAFGFSERNSIQLITGYPAEKQACAQQLFDNYSPFDIDGNLHPNYPEVPDKVVWTNATHVSHYVMRNISLTARRMVDQGQTVPMNFTFLWSYMQASLFNGACYMDDLDDLAEYATFSLLLNDPEYLKVNGECKHFPEKATAHRYFAKLPNSLLQEGQMLDGEMHQNKRVAAILFGGGLLLESGFQAPLFSGRVTAGEILSTDVNAGSCSNSRTYLTASWHGFSEKVGGIKEYLVSFGTKEKPSLYADRVSAGTNIQWSVTIGEKQALNATYIATVTAINAAGLQTIIESRPVRVLNDGAPVYGVVNDGPGLVDIDYQTSTTTLQANWHNFMQEEHAYRGYTSQAWTDNGFEYAVGVKDVSLNSVVDWTPVANWVSDISIGGLSLALKTVYTISIRARNCAGKYTIGTSDGIEVDLSPPIPGTVIVGNSTWKHQKTYFQAQALEARWFGFRDLVSSIASYEWALSNFPKAPDVTGNTGMIKGWENVGAVTYKKGEQLVTLPSANVNLAIGNAFYVHIKAIDIVGNQVVANSNATIIVGH